jgi:hypothetical protein
MYFCLEHLAHLQTSGADRGGQGRLSIHDFDCDIVMPAQLAF